MKDFLHNFNLMSMFLRLVLLLAKKEKPLKICRAAQELEFRYLRFMSSSILTHWCPYDFISFYLTRWLYKITMLGTTAFYLGNNFFNVVCDHWCMCIHAGNTFASAPWWSRYWEDTTDWWDPWTDWSCKTDGQWSNQRGLFIYATVSSCWSWSHLFLLWIL